MREQAAILIRLEVHDLEPFDPPRSLRTQQVFDRWPMSAAQPGHLLGDRIGPVETIVERLAPLPRELLDRRPCGVVPVLIDISLMTELGLALRRKSSTELDVAQHGAEWTDPRLAVLREQRLLALLRGGIGRAAQLQRDELTAWVV